MKVHLMHPDRDMRTSRADPVGSAELIADLELDILWDAMAAGDPLVRDVVRAATLRPLQSVDEIAYRQDVLSDCRSHPELLAELEQVAAHAATAERRAASWLFGHSASMSLSHAARVLGLLADDLRDLRLVVDRHCAGVRSTGWTQFVDSVQTELDDEYLERFRAEAAQLELKDGAVASLRIGPGGVSDLTLRRPLPGNHRILSHNPLHRPTRSWTVPARDESGARAMSELRDRVLHDAAVVALGACAQVQGFFATLRTELAFYRGCLNLLEALTRAGASWCLPVLAAEGPRLEVTDLVDPSLVLSTGSLAVTNDVQIRGEALLVLTGANHGGKSTLLRALGLAQLMAQAGMPVAARACRTSLVTGVFTHWAREEDATLRRGRLDEELARLSQVVTRIRRGALVLSNESLSSTNESEGASIALDVVRALLDAGVRVHLVTHLYDLSRPLYDDPTRPGVFLRAPRQVADTPHYRLEAGEPLPTSFARDLYEQVFGSPVASGVTVTGASS